MLSARVIALKRVLRHLTLPQCPLLSGRAKSTLYVILEEEVFLSPLLATRVQQPNVDGKILDGN